MRTGYVTLMAMLTMCLAGFIGCQKEIKYDLGNEIPPSTEEAPIWKTAGVTGQVIDANGMPVDAAEVKFGTSIKQTDKNGYFSFADASFSTGEAFVTVKKAGFFSGSRTFFPRQGSNNYLKIKLIAYRLSGTIDATAGGEIELRNGMKIELPAGGMVTKNGGAYSGDVNLFATYLDPTANDINERMPGDLRGVNTGGQQRALKSLGMVAAELYSPSGQPLNIKTGSKAKLTFQIPSSLASNAPNTVPLWYFNEATGLWVEEGVAARQGDEYIGEVSHFTFWNVDIPSEFIKLSIKITGLDNNPIAGAKVKLTSLLNQSAAYDFTDNTGYVIGGVPKGQQLKMEVFDNCENIVFTSTIGPFSTDTELGSKQVGSKVPLQTIYGTVNSCNGSPLASGVLQVLLSNNQSEFTIIENGKFSITFLSCSGAVNAQLIAIDNDNLQQGNPVTIQLDSINVNANQLQACGIAINGFLNLAVNGVPRVWNSGSSNLIEAYEDNTPGNDYLFFIAGDTSNFVSSGDGDFLGIIIEMGVPPAVASVPFSVPVRYIFIQEDSMYVEDYEPLDSNFQATITSYGPMGQFAEGNFNGQFLKESFDTVTVNCNFRIRRREIWW
ncbi:MAG TPA: carboxypeptidase-like regulatory domain-containing protein [Chitinophagaceae bacterium]|nr:carboxypeptidase-like regulatory domain-containing protein [Chitinophagaceae bacterium]